MSEVIEFENFQPGKVMGEAFVTFDDSLAACWQSIFGSQPEDGADAAAESASLAVVMMMRAYLQVVSPRPPGNVHARQSFRLEGLPQRGEAIRTEIVCTHKELRRERRYVELRACGTGEDGRPVYTGSMSMIWAA